MISEKNIESYQGISLSRGNDFLYVPPDVLLQPYISCYTITFPKNMPDEYTILPTASSRITISVNTGNIYNGIVGVNTKTLCVGNYANKMHLMLLIEFHVGCLYPFIQIDQNELADSSFALNDLDKTLTHTLENELIKSESIDALLIALNKIFLKRLTNFNMSNSITSIKNEILKYKGNISMKNLSSVFNYSEKHLRRLFLQYIGTSPKMFSRIVRINHALQLMQSNNIHLTDIAVKTGFFDQPHFIHDFKSICGLTPQEYMKNMSVFYNDNYKL